MSDAPEFADVVIVGAGLSGIGAAAHLQDRCPGKRFLILEARNNLGGTWDLFRYPGIRSDSDMHTLGYRFRPWTGDDAITSGASIKRYIADTARERGIDRSIRYGCRVVAAAWSSADARWTLEVEAGGDRRRVTCSFLILCAGYFSYAGGHRPTWPGEERFAGRFVHPQDWPDDLDTAGKRVAVIGSGATAMTLVPALAETAAHVTMVQRSPTYVVSRPTRDALALRLRRWLPAAAAYRITRWKNVLIGTLFYRLARTRPGRVRARLLAMVRAELGPDYDVDRHFSPGYDPWDQRICLVPDADLFAAIRDGRADVATGTIETFTEHGLRLSTGQEVAADVVVTATGLRLTAAGDVALSVDGTPVRPGDTMSYKGCMISGVPNLVTVFGYTNASWTLKADLVSAFACRIINRMDARGDAIVVARPDPTVGDAPLIDFTSGYVQRAAGLLPKQGDRHPWRLHQNYLRDLPLLRFGRINDGVLEFRRAG